MVNCPHCGEEMSAEEYLKHIDTCPAKRPSAIERLDTMMGGKRESRFEELQKELESWLEKMLKDETSAANEYFNYSRIATTLGLGTLADQLLDISRDETRHHSIISKSLVLLSRIS